MRKRAVLRRRYGRTLSGVSHHASFQPGDPVMFRRSGGQLAYGRIVMFVGDRVKVSFCERQLEKWLPVADVAKSAHDMVW